MTQIDLQLIKDNPYQPREADDPDHIEKLARSIAADGLLQMPTARRVNGHYELAFGHSRRKAFEWLTKNWKKQSLQERFDGYSVMPLNVEELEDRQMYRHAVTENVQRKDLAPTEVAKSLKEYMEKFNANSKEAGELFGLSDATVRGMVRLLELPKEVQTALDTGKISQGTARAFHSMQRIAPKEEIIKTLKKVEQEKGTSLPEDVIEGKIERLPNVVDLWNEHHRDGKPRAGYHGWLLDMKNFPNNLLPQMNEAQVGAYEKQIEHLTNPPACTACPFYTKVRGSHYCGLKFCYERKTYAWQAYLIEQASKRLGISIYQESDGRYAILKGYETPHKQLFTKKHAGLRLIPKSQVDRYAFQSGFEGVDDDAMLVVATGDALNRLGSGAKAKGGKRTEKEKAEMRAMKVYRVRRKELMWEFTGVAKSIFESVPDKVIGQLLRRRNILIDDAIPEEYKRGNAPGEYQRRELVWTLIMDDSSHFHRKGMATQLKAFEARTCVKPGKALVKRAEEWDAEINAVAKPVSTETPKKGKKG